MRWKSCGAEVCAHAEILFRPHDLHRSARFDGGGDTILMLEILQRCLMAASASPVDVRRPSRHVYTVAILRLWGDTRGDDRATNFTALQAILCARLRVSTTAEIP